RRAGMTLDGGFGSQPFPSVVGIACVSKCRKPVVRMGLQDRRSRACDFSTLAPQVAGNCDQITAAMRRRKVWRLRKGPLSGCLFGCIDIDHGPMLALPVPH